METWIDIDAIKPHPANPRVGYLPAIKDAIARNGWHGAVVIQKSTDYILAGNHRWLAAKELGLKRVLAHYVDVDDATARRILLSDNRTSDLATYDDRALQETLALIIAEAPEAPTEALKGTGYTQEDAEQLAIGLSGGEQQQWGSAGDPQEERQIYAETAIRQIVWILSAEEYERVVPLMRKIVDDNHLDTFSDAMFFLLDRYGPAIDPVGAEVREDPDPPYGGAQPAEAGAGSHIPAPAPNGANTGDGQ